MSWVANRETTRPEDMSYCLLGIFNINMPMLYGEGAKAFQRLQEEIIKRTNDLSIFAWVDDRTPEQVPGTSFVNLFAASPRDFLNCRFLKPEPPALSRNHNFTLTNNGLFLSGAKFTLDFDHGYYFLRIGSTPTSTRYLALKRISSKIFFRVAFTDPGIVMALRYSPFGPDDVFIPPKIGPIGMAFFADSNLDFVQVRSHRDGRSFQFELHISILDVFPKESWDASRLTFLQDATNPPSKGYIKFHGPVFESQVGRTFHKPPSQNFYLVWHLKHINEGRSLVSFIDAKVYTEERFVLEKESLFGSRPLLLPFLASSEEAMSLARSPQRIFLGSGHVTAKSGHLGRSGPHEDRFFIDLSYERDGPHLPVA
jgi:hypothetical protein